MLQINSNVHCVDAAQLNVILYKAMCLKYWNESCVLSSFYNFLNRLLYQKSNVESVFSF